MLSAERLRTNLNEKPIAIGKTKRTLTVSIGVATRDPGTVDMDALVSIADQGLYAAKEAGRNQTCTRQQSLFP